MGSAYRIEREKERVRAAISRLWYTWGFHEVKICLPGNFSALLSCAVGLPVSCTSMSASTHTNTHMHMVLSAHALSNAFVQCFSGPCDEPKTPSVRLGHDTVSHEHTNLKTHVHNFESSTNSHVSYR